MSAWTICGANLLALVGLAAIVVSLATEYWVKIDVARDKLSNNIKSEVKEIYYTRQRGVFRTCFEGDAQWLKNYDPVGKVVRSECLIEDIFSLSNNSDVVALGKQYNTRLDLIRVHLAFQAISILVLSAAFLTGLCGCHKYSASTVRISGILSLVSSLFMAGAMTVFHVYEYIEKQRINNEMFYKVWSALPAMNGKYSYKYHFSYMLGWIGMALAFLTAVLYLFLASDVIKEKERMRERRERYAEDRRRNYDNLVENTPYGRPYHKDPYRY